jgi:hypothetical protein|nr:MAG TPA: hypothetical protein [Caudoviricetes sp.]
MGYFIRNVRRFVEQIPQFSSRKGFNAFKKHLFVASFSFFRGNHATKFGQSMKIQ